jgi:hypothetical protein
MKKLLVLGALALFSMPVTAALAVPMCDGPHFDLRDSNGNPIYSEEDLALQAEQRLKAHGIDAHQTRFWNGCIQTFVNDGSGHDQMKFYDYDSLREIPVN